MINVGVTGGIGSGKSTVCRVWERLGAYNLNADELAKQVMTSDPEVREEIIQAFGENSYHDDGSLNRDHLAREAFRKGRVEELNSIVHPRMPAAVRKEMTKAGAAGHMVFVYEAALLLENLQPGLLDYIVLVLAEEEERIKRVRDRDATTEEDVKRRISRQRNFEDAIHRADIVIRNNGTVRELEEKAEEVYKKFFLTGKQ